MKLKGTRVHKAYRLLLKSVPSILFTDLTTERRSPSFCCEGLRFLCLPYELHRTIAIDLVVMAMNMLHGRVGLVRPVTPVQSLVTRPKILP